MLWAALCITANSGCQCRAREVCFAPIMGQVRPKGVVAFSHRRRLAQSVWLRRFSYAQSAKVFRMTSPQRLLLHALLSGLGDAVGRNDEAAAYRYRTRIRLIARQHFDTNPSISDALERLLSASGRWLETNVAERSKAEQPVLEHIERVTELL